MGIDCKMIAGGCQPGSSASRDEPDAIRGIGRRLWAGRCRRSRCAARLTTPCARTGQATPDRFVRKRCEMRVDDPSSQRAASTHGVGPLRVLSSSPSPRSRHRQEDHQCRPPPRRDPTHDGAPLRRDGLGGRGRRDEHGAGLALGPRLTFGVDDSRCDSISVGVGAPPRRTIGRGWGRGKKAEGCEDGRSSDFRRDARI